MADVKTYIKEGLKIVKTLVNQGDLETALLSCKELLKVNPYDKKTQKTLREIQQLIIKKNSVKVDADIEKTIHLWREGRYEDLLNIYSRLYQYAPEHSKLKKLTAKLNEKLSEQQKNDRSDFINKALGVIAGLLRENRYGDAIQACNELLNLDPLNQEAKNYCKKTKNLLIEQKLKENTYLMDSADFQRALEFYESLLMIDPKHPQANKLAFQAKEHLAHQAMLANKIHLNESIGRMKELFKNAEYEKTIQACEEIDRLDRGNFTARLFRKKAENTISAEIAIKSVKKMKEAWAMLTPEYKKNPQAFLRI